MNDEKPKSTILVVDDTTDNRKILQRVLINTGYIVNEAADGPKALEMIKENPPDMILLDIFMPGMDGYEVCQQLKNEKLLRDIPVIFISALDDMLDKEKAFSVGGVDYITKPIEIQDVLMRVDTHLSLRNIQKQLQHKNAALEQEINRREKVEQQLKVQAATDPLTKLFNRRQFFDYAEIEISRSGRKNRPIAVMMMDIDHFKNVNDTYGHMVGDQVLLKLAEMFQEDLRKYDIIARYGGEEFIALLPETDLNQCKIIAERVRWLVANTSMKFEQAELSITISIGTACLDTDSDRNLHELLESADRALYQSKRAGRNRVTTE